MLRVKEAEAHAKGTKAHAPGVVQVEVYALEVIEERV